MAMVKKNNKFKNFFLGKRGGSWWVGLERGGVVREKKTEEK